MPTTMRAYASAMSLRYVESAYGVTTAALQAVLTVLLGVIDPDFVNTEFEFIDDGAKVQKKRGATTDRLQSERGSVSKRFYFSTRALAPFLIQMLQDVTSSAVSTGASEVQTWTHTGTVTAGAGYFTFKNESTPILAYTVSAAALQAALEALPSIGTGNVTVGKVGQVWTITFQGALANLPVPQIVFTPTTAFVGGTEAMATTTPGLAAGIFTHTIQWPNICTVTQPGQEFVEALECGGATSQYMLFTGAVTNKIRLELDGKGWINLAIDMLTDGGETVVSSFGFPATPTAVVDLLGNMVSVALGDGAGDLLADNELRSLAIEFNANLSEKRYINKQTKVTEYRSSGHPTLTIEGSISGDKSHRVYGLIRRQRLGTMAYCRVTIDPETGPATSQQNFQLTATACKITGTATHDGEDPVINFTLEARENTTDDGLATIVLRTPEASYLQAAP